jgi:methyl-accepting chemotaxis protein
MLSTIQSWQQDILTNKEQTDACSKVAEQSTVRLSEVEEMMQTMSGLMVDVAQTADNQLKLASDVNLHIQSIASTAEQNLAATHSVEQNSLQLKEQVKDFYQLALRFEDKPS